MARVLSADWQRLYHHPIYLLESFIDPERFRGTAYQAAHWVYLGPTTGRGKDDLTHRANRSLKQLWVYPLVADFRGLVPSDAYVEAAAAAKERDDRIAAAIKHIEQQGVRGAGAGGPAAPPTDTHGNQATAERGVGAWMNDTPLE